MRIRRPIRLVVLGLMVLAVGCGVIDSSDEDRLLPLKSAVSFTIGQYYRDSAYPHLFVQTSIGYASPCYHLNGSFLLAPDKKRINVLIDGVRFYSKGGCVDLFTSAQLIWKLSPLEPAIYSLRLEMRYPHGYRVIDLYTVEYVSPDSVTISPLRGDSSFVWRDVY